MGRIRRAGRTIPAPPERRYYIDTESALVLMCMIEDGRLCNAEDCGAALPETAQGIARKR